MVKYNLLVTIPHRWIKSINDVAGFTEGKQLILHNEGLQLQYAEVAAWSLQEVIDGLLRSELEATIPILSGKLITETNMLFVQY